MHTDLWVFPVINDCAVRYPMSLLLARRSCQSVLASGSGHSAFATCSSTSGASHRYSKPDLIMVLGLLTAIAACPAIVGTAEAVRYGEKQNQRDEHRGRKNELRITLHRHSGNSFLFDGASVVLKDNKLFVDVRKVAQASDDLHPFTGYFLPYPERAEVWRAKGFLRGEGMVTTTNSENFLNWVYVDRNTYEVKYGVRAESDPHRAGPFDCTKIDRRLTFEGWEGFIAVEEEEGNGLWALYFDCDDDGLRGHDRIGTKDKRVLEVEIWRRELRLDKESAVDERVERLQLRKEKLRKP